MKHNIDEIISIIREPAHGQQFYSRSSMRALLDEVEDICKNIGITEATPDRTKIKIINNYVKQNVKLRAPYFEAFNEETDKFNENELVYRTAYGALVKGEAMCAGYAEATRILLSQFGVKSHTLLAKLPGRDKRLLHYVVLAEYDEDGEKKYEVLDPERQRKCESRGWDFESYRNNMVYMNPLPEFTNDVVGENGVGIFASEYVEKTKTKQIEGVDNIQELLSNDIEKRGDLDDR